MFLLNGGEDFLEIMDKCLKTCYNVGIGSLAQLARAPRLHRGGQGFESLATHQILVIIRHFGDFLCSLDDKSRFTQRKHQSRRFDLTNSFWDYFLRNLGLTSSKLIAFFWKVRMVRRMTKKDRITISTRPIKSSGVERVPNTLLSIMAVGVESGK